MEVSFLVSAGRPDFPLDLAARSLVDGDRIAIHSDHAQIVAIVKDEPSARPGVVSIAHAWGDLPSENVDVVTHGSSTNRFIRTDRDTNPLNPMPRMSAIPVSIVSLPYR